MGVVGLVVVAPVPAAFVVLVSGVARMSAVVVSEMLSSASVIIVSCIHTILPSVSASVSRHSKEQESKRREKAGSTGLAGLRFRRSGRCPAPQIGYN
jgi:hypothetical protein